MKVVRGGILTAIAGGALLATACADRETAKDPCCTLTITATPPEGTGEVYLTGSAAALGPWKADALKMDPVGDNRVAFVSLPRGSSLEYKFTLGAWSREATDAAGVPLRNFSLTVNDDMSVSHTLKGFRRDPDELVDDWRAGGVVGRIVTWRQLASAYLGPRRNVTVWLPPGYDESTGKYPVIYMHDGQNLFDPRLANFGVDWGVDEAIARLAAAGEIRPAIVVGIWSTEDRRREYSPWHGAADMANFILREVRPRIAAQFRVLSGPENTFAMGSSMGGLLSFYLVRNHPDVFGGCGCVSTHFTLSEKMAVENGAAPPADAAALADRKPDATPYILHDIAAGAQVPKGRRYWFDYGTLGLDADYGPTHKAVREWLLKQGFAEGDDFVIRRYDGADHDEASWRARLEDPLKFLLAPAPDNADDAPTAAD